MSTKIQINSLAALERLIGGDTELEIEVRQSVVDAFTAKHLRKIAESAPIEETSRKLREGLIAEVNRVATEQIGSIVESGDPWRRITKVELRPELKSQIEREVSGAAWRAGEEFVAKTINELNLSKFIDQKITQQLNREVDRLVEEKLKKIRSSI